MWSAIWEHLPVMSRPSRSSSNIVNLPRSMQEGVRGRHDSRGAILYTPPARTTWRWRVNKSGGSGRFIFPLSFMSILVTGLFQTQLKDGIMGMDNRKGAFWLQLHEHYKRNGYHAVPPEENEKQPGDNTNDNVVFDPTQFSSRWRGMIINPSPST
mmetsp:Transcript_5733/g.9024  ORF Transcript_5733/g.9024 Transcript_5733/m.9024 type:complete len:155 (+) Transcript_5733:1239-1703(+)